jgi:hypothetical protein
VNLSEQVSDAMLALPVTDVFPWQFKKGAKE